MDKRDVYSVRPKEVGDFLDFVAGMFGEKSEEICKKELQATSVCDVPKLVNALDLDKLFGDVLRRAVPGFLELGDEMAPLPIPAHNSCAD